MEKLIKALNKQVANLSVLFTKLHHYHWYVEGPGFFTFHSKLEELYDATNELYDDVAERILQIGGNPVSNMKQYLELAVIEEASGKEDAITMIKHVLNDYKVLRDEFLETLKLAQDASDEVTADMLIGALTAFEKNIWMLGATIK